MNRFDDRQDAGEQLGEHLVAEGVDADIVLAIPRGGLPVGRAVADALDAPLDIVVARKIGAPHNPELAIGAVAADGAVWLNEEMVDRTRATDAYIDDEATEEEANARDKADRYRDEAPDLAGKRVVVTDDGVATGATMIACLRQVHDAGAAEVIAAVPVGPPGSIRDLEAEADAVYCLHEPASFHAVGQFYRDFGQVQDEEAMAYLDGR